MVKRKTKLIINRPIKVINKSFTTCVVLSCLQPQFVCYLYQKRVLVMIKHCLENSQINSIQAWSKEIPYITFFHRTNAKVYAYNQSKQILFIYSAKLKTFPTLKTHLSIHQEHKRTQKSHGSFFPAIAVKNPQENLASFNILILQRDNIHAKTHDTCVDQRGYMTSGWRNLSHSMGPRGSQDLRSPSPIMAPVSTKNRELWPDPTTFRC